MSNRNHPKGKWAYYGICDIAEMWGGGGEEEELDKERFTKNNLRYVRSGQMGQYVSRLARARRPKQDWKGSYNFQDPIERAPAEFHIRENIQRVLEVSSETRFM